MHIILVVAYGLLALGAFLLMAWLLNQRGFALDGARFFIPVWLLASVLNSVVGVVYAGIPVANEIGAFIVIFGVPAALAWYLSLRFRSRTLQ